MDISFDGKNNYYRLWHNGVNYVLYMKRKWEKAFNVVGVHSKLESVLEQALRWEISESDSHSFADVYAAIEDAKQFVKRVVSEINETQFKGKLNAL